MNVCTSSLIELAPREIRVFAGGSQSRASKVSIHSKSCENALSRYCDAICDVNLGFSEKPLLQINVRSASECMHAYGRLALVDSYVSHSTFASFARNDQTLKYF